MVPVVVAAGEQDDLVSPAEVADASAAGKRLSEDSRHRLQQAARQFVDDASESFDRHARDEPAVASLTLAEVMHDPHQVVSSVVDLQSMVVDGFPAAIGIASEMSIDEANYFAAYLRAERRSRRNPLLLRALFVAAVGTLEPLVTRVVQLLMHHGNPQVYSSLGDPMLDDKARRLCFGSPDTWRTALVDHLQVSKLADVIDWVRLKQLWQDRHAIVHRGGYVDARHNATSGIEIGTVLAPNADDVQGAIDDIGAARYAIVAAAWAHVEPGVGGPLADKTTLHLWDSLRAGRWRQAEALARLQQSLATDSEGVAAANVNRWLARDLGLGAEAIFDEVNAWDVSRLPAEFAMARLFLLRDDEPALGILNACVRHGSMTKADLATWPLLDRMRDDGRLAHLEGS